MEASEKVREPRGWSWILAYGVLLVLVGVIALSNPAATGLAAGIFLGVMLLIYGITGIAAGFSPALKKLGWLEIFTGGLAIVASVFVLFNPLAGAISLAWVIGAWLCVSGIFHIIYAINAREDRGWRLVLGVIDTILGALLLHSGPTTALTFIATLVGLSFLFRGAMLLILSMTLRRLATA